MSFYNTVSYHGEDWQYSCLDFDTKLDEDIARNVMWNIVDMYQLNGEKRNIGNEDYKARIEFNGSSSIGTLSGDVFTANIETDKKESRLSIILLSKIPRHKLN